MSEQIRERPVDDHQATGELLGREIHFQYSATALTYAIIGLRLVMGWIFLQAGLQKLLTDWTAAGFLTNAVAETNPFHGFFTSLAGNPVVDFLNIWGAILIGIALMLGLAMRWSAFWGAVMMLFYWAAGLQGGLRDFLPLENGWIIDSHIIYITLLFGLGAIGAGRVMGVDAWLEKQDVVQNNPWLLYLLG